MPRIITIILLSILLVPLSHADNNKNQIKTIVKMRANVGPNYYQQLVTRALLATSDSHGEFEIRLTPKKFPAKRLIEEVRKAKQLNLYTVPATYKIIGDDPLIAIPIPLLQGISGFRIPIIHNNQIERFKNISTLDDLKRITIGQATGWADIEIYEANNLHVKSAPYESLYALTNIGRIDTLLLGAEQVEASLMKRKERYPNLVIDDSTLVYYPLPVFFFVSKKEPELAERLRIGLEALIVSGEMKDLFNEHFEERLNALNIENRQLIRLNNPYLIDGIPFERKELWFPTSKALNGEPPKLDFSGPTTPEDTLKGKLTSFVARAN
ncbi:MAG: ABC-type amino acid transport substrate-binding protein [Flavobacteriales bacterium]|jgi:ABC-type amino acid transport substrate-binding protein